MKKVYREKGCMTDIISRALESANWRTVLSQLAPCKSYLSKEINAKYVGETFQERKVRPVTKPFSTGTESKSKPLLAFHLSFEGVNIHILMVQQPTW